MKLGSENFQFSLPLLLPLQITENNAQKADFFWNITFVGFDPGKLSPTVVEASLLSVPFFYATSFSGGKLFTSRLNGVVFRKKLARFIYGTTF